MKKAKWIGTLGSSVFSEAFEGYETHLFALIRSFLRILTSIVSGKINLIEIVTDFTKFGGQRFTLL
jgi:hypothetical protein